MGPLNRINKTLDRMLDNERLLSSIENYLAQRELPSEPERIYAPIGH